MITPLGLCGGSQVTVIVEGVADDETVTGPGAKEDKHLQISESQGTTLSH